MRRSKKQKDRKQPQIFHIESSDSSSSSNDSNDNKKVKLQKNEFSASQPYIQSHPIPANTNDTAKEEEEKKTTTIPRIQSIPTVNVTSLKLLDRYRSSTPRASTRLQLIPIEKRVNHYRVHREKEWQGATYHRVFSMFSLDKPNQAPIAKATFASTFSQEIKVVNNNGLICEIDTDADGKYQMRLGNDVSLSMKKEAGHAIFAIFSIVDGVVPPYKVLTSPPGACEDIKAAFGERKAIKSIKNCKLCYDGEEIVAVRKVGKNDVEIDAKGTISFLACFSIAIFMYVQ